VRHTDEVVEERQLRGGSAARRRSTAASAAARSPSVAPCSTRACAAFRRRLRASWTMPPFYYGQGRSAMPGMRRSTPAVQQVVAACGHIHGTTGVPQNAADFAAMPKLAGLDQSRVRGGLVRGLPRRRLVHVRCPPQQAAEIQWRGVGRYADIAEIACAVPRIGRILMARGRDATDVAIVTSFGLCTLVGFKVITEEVTSAGKRNESRWPSGLPIA
jgi:hypothetical protein